MAKQRGILKIEGTLDDITFFKSQDGYLVRQKGGVSAGRIATDPAFQRTRENGAEFGRAGKAGKTLRNAFRTALLNAKDSRVASRLTKEMMRVIHSDDTGARGSRSVTGGNVALLEGFDFNQNARLNTTLYAPFTATLNHTTGDASVVVEGFAPLERLAAPEGATHFKMVSMAADVDFATGAYITDAADTTVMPIDGTELAPITMASTLSPASTNPLFLLLGIQFYQEVNGVQYPLKNGAFNALSIVKVSKA